MSERLLRYAEASKEWTHGMKTEDELLQRIWNLAGDVTTLTTALVFYADYDNYDADYEDAPSRVQEDRGETARDALGRH